MADPLGVMFCLSLLDAKSLDAAKDYDITPEILQDEAASMMTVILKFAAKHGGRLPRVDTVLRRTSVDLKDVFGSKSECPTEFDPPDTYAQELRARHVGTTISREIREITKALRKSPEDGARRFREAATAVRASSLLRADQIVNLVDPKRIQLQREAYEKAKKFGSGISGLTTLAPSIDEKSLGWHGGEVIVVSGREKMGKTSWVLGNMVHIWQAHGSPLIWEGEMPIDQIERKAHAAKARISYENLRAGRLGVFGERKWNTYLEELEEHPPPPFHVVDIQAAKSVEEIAHLAMDLRVKCVFIDGLYILSRRGADSMWERTVNVIADCKEWAKITNLPWIVTTQLAGTTKGDALNATSGDLGYAKAIAQYADVVFGLFANKDLRKNNRRVLRTICARDFVPVDVLIKFDVDRSDYTELGVIEGDHVSRIEEITTTEEEEDDAEEAGKTTAGPAKTILIPF